MNIGFATTSTWFENLQERGGGRFVGYDGGYDDRLWIERHPWNYVVASTAVTAGLRDINPRLLL